MDLVAPAPLVDAILGRSAALVFSAGVHCGEAAHLQDIARANRSDSVFLKVRAQEVRGARRLHGGSDTAPRHPLLASLLAASAICADCIALRLGMARCEAYDALQRLVRTWRSTRRSPAAVGACASGWCIGSRSKVGADARSALWARERQHALRAR